jgi:hypothetical protein
MYLPATAPSSSACRRAALAMAGTTGLVLVALSHHPVAIKASSVQQTLALLAELQFTDGLVHGVLTIMLAMLAAGFATFSVVLGLKRPAVVLAMTAYGLGCCVVVAAMLLDGFVVPQVAAKFASAPGTEVQIAYAFLRIVGTVIQVLTKAGLLAMCVALLAWSYALAATPSWTGARWCAAIGAAGGLGSGLFLLLGNVLLTPASLMAIFAVHALWNAGVAGLMFQFSRTIASKQIKPKQIVDSDLVPLI